MEFFAVVPHLFFLLQNLANALAEAMAYFALLQGYPVLDLVVPKDFAAMAFLFA